MADGVRDFSSPLVREKWLGELLGLTGHPDEEQDWNGKAHELFAWQYERVPAYQNLCLAYGIDPKNLPSWQFIPAAPQQLFKEHHIFASSRTPSIVYETSGSTTGKPGRQNLLSTDIYRGVCIAGAARAGLDPVKTVRRLHFLAPSPQENPKSSLSAMFGFWAKAHPSAGTALPPKFWVKDGSLDAEGLRRELIEDAERKLPVGIAGSAFHYVHLLDAWKNVSKKVKLALPSGSWLLETGGFKGRCREIPKPELYTELSRAFMLKKNTIWNEYGMSELSSQAYAHGENGLHQLPPWARVLVVDPFTNRPVRPGRMGLVRWFDLANVDSLMALQTLDLAEASKGESFRLVGRMPTTEPRGCSLQAEDMIPTAPESEI